MMKLVLQIDDALYGELLIKYGDIAKAIRYAIENYLFPRVDVRRVDEFSFELSPRRNVVMTFKISHELYKKSEKIKNKSEILKKLIDEFLEGKLDITQYKAERNVKKVQSIFIDEVRKRMLEEKARANGITLSGLLNILYQIMVSKNAC